ncbi:hypothetical protein CBS101457_001655 [Exobasidium rhododendri]|nr:hypothetical protein CBS101457_001655 [Exobasidium rhododendri]
MPPRRKSQAEAAGVVANLEDSSAAMVEDGARAAVLGGEEDEEEAGGAASSSIPAPIKPVSFVTKQQKDAASGADGIDQYELARTQVTKIAKSAIPDSVQLRKEVIQALIKSSTVFINYISSAALDKTHEAGNKTLSATHVINAFKEMGFPEEYANQLRREYSDKVKLEADRAKANKAAKADAARAEGSSMDVDMDETLATVNEDVIRIEGDESMAVDLSKEGAEEEVEEEDEVEIEEPEKEDDEEEEEEEEEEGAEGAVEEANEGDEETSDHDVP